MTDDVRIFPSLNKALADKLYWALDGSTSPSTGDWTHNADFTMGGTFNTRHIVPRQDGIQANGGYVYGYRSFSADDPIATSRMYWGNITFLDAQIIFGGISLVADTIHDLGTATGGSSNSVIDTSQSWTIDEHIGRTVRKRQFQSNGAIHEEYAVITSNSATALNISGSFVINAASGQIYDIATVGERTVQIGTTLRPTTLRCISDVHIFGQSDLRFYEGANYVGFKAPSLSANQIWNLPATDALGAMVSDNSGNLSLSLIKDNHVDWGTGANQISAVDVPVNVTNFGNQLSSSDTDVKTALETLDDLPISTFFNGTFRESFDATVVSNGTTITMSLEQSGTGDLSMQFSDGLTILDCTDPLQTIALTEGSDNSPQVNYIYIPQSSKVLTKSTSGWTSSEHIKVGFFFCQSALSMQTAGGPIINQNHNNDFSGINNQGDASHISEKLRLLGASYFSGVSGNGTTGYLTITAGNVELKMTSGIIFQKHKQTFPAFDTSGSDTVHIKNESGNSFKAITNLHDITKDSTGATIGNNKYFNLVLWGVQNKMGEHQTVLINLPSGFYNTQKDAENDVLGYDDFTIPREFGIDSSTGFLIVRITLKMGGTWTHVSEVDLRGTTPQTASGGASGIVTSFADNTFDVFDESDDTKVMVFDVGTNVTTGNTRTLQIPDASGIIALTTNADGSISAAGSDTQVQYNNSGSFGGDSSFTWDDTNDRLTLGTTLTDNAKLRINSDHDSSIGNDSFTGSGTDDLTLGGTYTGTEPLDYKIEIDSHFDDGALFTAGPVFTVNLHSTAHGITALSGILILVSNSTNYDGVYTEGVHFTVVDVDNLNLISAPYSFDRTGTIEYIPNTFRWSDDGGSTWDAEDVAMTGSAQDLNNGITATFGGPIGHQTGDFWTFSVVEDDHMIIAKDSGNNLTFRVNAGNTVQVGDEHTIDNDSDNTFVTGTSNTVINSPDGVILGGNFNTLNAGDGLPSVVGGRFMKNSAKGSFLYGMKAVEPAYELTTDNTFQIYGMNLSALQGIIVGNLTDAKHIDDSTHGGTSDILYIGNETIDTTPVSDKRTKKNIKNIELGINDLLEIDVKQFNYKTKYSEDESLQYGIIAQDLEKTSSNYAVKTISKHEDLKDLKIIKYQKLIPLMIKSIQDLKQEIEELKK